MAVLSSRQEQARAVDQVCQHVTEFEARLPSEGILRQNGRQRRQHARRAAAPRHDWNQEGQRRCTRGES